MSQLDTKQNKRLDGNQPGIETNDSVRGCRSFSASAYSISGLRWACVYTHPQAERWARDNLATRGYRPYLPLCTVLVRDRVTPTIARPVQRPLYPRYLFLPFDHRTTSWTPIRDTPGVVGLVRSGTAVHYARAGDVERLQETEAQRELPPAPDTPWRVGDACRLAHGAFSGQVGVVRMVVGELARLQLMMFGGLRDVVVNVDVLAPRDE